MADTQVEDKQVEEETELLYRTNESPALSTAFLMGFQVCLFICVIYCFCFIEKYIDFST